MREPGAGAGAVVHLQMALFGVKLVNPALIDVEQFQLLVQGQGQGELQMATVGRVKLVNPALLLLEALRWVQCCQHICDSSGCFLVAPMLTAEATEQ